MASPGLMSTTSCRSSVSMCVCPCTRSVLSCFCSCDDERDDHPGLGCFDVGFDVGESLQVVDALVILFGRGGVEGLTLARPDLIHDDRRRRPGGFRRCGCLNAAAREASKAGVSRFGRAGGGRMAAGAVAGAVACAGADVAAASCRATIRGETACQSLPAGSLFTWSILS